MNKKSSFTPILKEAKRIKFGLEKPKEEEYAQITIRVFKKDREHWQSAAKKEGKTITQIIIKHLKEKYGESLDL